jgi:CO/xanthine dehydrogenase Mo-binding subunit
MRKDGTITAAHAELRYQGGAYPGSPVEYGAMACFAPYDLKNVRSVGYDVVTNRPKQAAYRAPGAPMAAFAVESVIDELCTKLGLDPREKVGLCLRIARIGIGEAPVGEHRQVDLPGHADDLHARAGPAERLRRHLKLAPGIAFGQRVRDIRRDHLCPPRGGGEAGERIGE